MDGPTRTKSYGRNHVYEFGIIHPYGSNTADNTTWMKSHGWELENSSNKGLINLTHFYKNRLINFQHVKDKTYLKLTVSV